MRFILPAFIIFSMSFSQVGVALAALAQDATAKDRPKHQGYVFVSSTGSVAQLSCSFRAKKCALKLDKFKKEYDGVTQLLFLETSGSERHLSSAKVDRLATFYFSEGEPYLLTLWKAANGKKLDFKIDILKTEKLDADELFSGAVPHDDLSEGQPAMHTETIHEQFSMYDRKSVCSRLT
jgi:hypothetical protein